MTAYTHARTALGGSQRLGRGQSVHRNSAKRLLLPFDRLGVEGGRKRILPPPAPRERLEAGRNGPVYEFYLLALGVEAQRVENGVNGL